MEFKDRLYYLRKQKGLSQEELANCIHVSRQTVSKWEVGDSTPDMERLAALGEVFEISLDELITGKSVKKENTVSSGKEFVNLVQENILTSDNKRRVRKGLKIAGAVAGIIIAADVVSLIVYFTLYGIPK